MLDKHQVMYKILDLARWAPSGDNTQPWLFEIISETECIIHTKDTRETVICQLPH